MEVFVVTVEAVYDHGCCGVFTTVEAAEQRAWKLWNGSDGHHLFRIDRIELDTELGSKKWEGLLMAFLDDDERDRRRAVNRSYLTGSPVYRTWDTD